ncbi:uncharacterized protein G2W53_017879 [Senna tora]|uniref:Uncharacterized protein n=1 Tax=Senna tora TaxID=362788 RepID=A0A834WKJ9_9FABA|nr:uncharacterized protein G2W53_017879 [Senna tora]
MAKNKVLKLHHCYQQQEGGTGPGANPTT